MNRLNLATTFIALALLGACAQDAGTDLKSQRLGSTASWAEAVSVGVKELALSSPATPSEMDQIVTDAEGIAERFGVSIYRESDLLELAENLGRKHCPGERSRDRNDELRSEPDSSGLLECNTQAEAPFSATWEKSAIPVLKSV